MDIPRAIATAAAPDAHTVCGVTLRPFCIGHWLHMTRCDVSFITGAPQHELGDLLTAVLICSETFEGFTEGLRLGGVERAMLSLRRSLSGGFYGWLKRRFQRNVRPADVLGFNFPAECIKLQNYLVDHGAVGNPRNGWAIPLTATTDSGKSMPINAPFPMVLLDALVSECGVEESAALNMPIPYARWRHAVHSERNGRLTIVDRDDNASNQEEADRYVAELMKEAANG